MLINVVLPSKGKDIAHFHEPQIQSLLWTGIIAAVWHSAHYLEHFIVGVVCTVSFDSFPTEFTLLRDSR